MTNARCSSYDLSIPEGQGARPFNKWLGSSFRCQKLLTNCARALKNGCFWTVVLEKTLESPLDSKEIQPFNPKGNQSWIFIGRTEAEALILWPPDAKSWFIGKDSDAGTDRRQEKKGMTEDEMVGWHHRLDGHEFEQAPGDGEGQGSLACRSQWQLQRVGCDWELKKWCQMFD